MNTNKDELWSVNLNYNKMLTGKPDKAGFNCSLLLAVKNCGRINLFCRNCWWYWIPFPSGVHVHQVVFPSLPVAYMTLIITEWMGGLFLAIKR